MTPLGRPHEIVNIEHVQEWRKLNFTWRKIAQLMNISRSTLYRRLNEAAISSSDYTPLSSGELDQMIMEIKINHPNDGEVLMQGHLLHQGVKVPRQMLRESIHRVDHDNVVSRRRSVVERRVYSVPHPNYIWHIDSHHKLIKWHFVVHGAVDGFSRTIIYLQCTDNNRAPTVLEYFHEAVSRFGLPESVRSDHGGENVGVWRYVMVSHNMDHSCVVTGSSVHNERIERMWRDVHRCVIKVFSDIFTSLEMEAVLDPINEVDLYCLYHIFLPLIVKNLSEFQESWNSHALSSEGNRTPYQLLMEGLFEAVNNHEYEIGSLCASNDIDISQLTNEHVQVPRLSFRPCNGLTQNLEMIQATDISNAKLLYTRTVETAGLHLLSGCSDCVSS